MDISIPTVMDTIDNKVSLQFAAWPERIFILQNSKAIYCGGPGPWEFKPDEARQVLGQLDN